MRPAGTATPLDPAFARGGGESPLRGLSPERDTPSPQLDREPGSPPLDAARQPGMQRFEAALQRTLAALADEQLEQRWSTAASRLDRIAQWQDPDGHKARSDIADLLAEGDAAEEPDGPPSMTWVASAFASLSRLFQVLRQCVPALSGAAEETLRRLLCSVCIDPPELPKHASAEALMLGLSDTSLWCHCGLLRHGTGRSPKGSPGTAKLHPPGRQITSISCLTGGEPAEDDVDAIYLRETGVAQALEHVTGLLSATKPPDPFHMLADHFTHKAYRRLEVPEVRFELSGKGQAYLSRRRAIATEGSDLRRAALTELVDHPVAASSGFGGFRSRHPGAPNSMYFSAATLHPHHMYPVQLRPAHTFVHQLGRDWSDAREMLPGVPVLRLAKPVAEWAKQGPDVVINAQAIDRFAANAPIEDRVWRAQCAGRDVTSLRAESVFGSATFRISRKEIAALEGSTRVLTTGQLKDRFLTELARITTDPEVSWFCSLFRATPLGQYGMPAAGAALKRIYTEHKESEEEAIAQLSEEMASLRRQTEQAQSAGRIAGDAIINLLAKKESEIQQHGLRRAASEAKLVDLGRNEEILRISDRFQALFEKVLATPQKYGFSSTHLAGRLLDQSLIEICTLLCISQLGYFFVDGCNGGQNLLAEKTPEPITFLSATGIDLNTPATTAREAPKYFKRSGGTAADGEAFTGWRGFIDGGEDRLLMRVKELYVAILESCQHHGVRNPSMLAMGLGVYLLNVHNQDRAKVCEIYFRAQFELLCERDWGFETYYLNAAQNNAAAIEVLENGIRSGEYNNIRKGRCLRCNVAIHTRDAKFLAVELAKRGMGAAMLNPSDCGALILGNVGNHWEQGRMGHYAGEEDFAATGTGLLAHGGLTAVRTDPGRCLFAGTLSQQLAIPLSKKDKDRGPASALSPATSSIMCDRQMQSTGELLSPRSDASALPRGPSSRLLGGPIIVSPVAEPASAPHR